MTSWQSQLPTQRKHCIPLYSTLGTKVGMPAEPGIMEMDGEQWGSETVLVLLAILLAAVPWMLEDRRLLGQRQETWLQQSHGWSVHTLTAVARTSAPMAMQRARWRVSTQCRSRAKHLGCIKGEESRAETQAIKKKLFIGIDTQCCISFMCIAKWISFYFLLDSIPI